VAAIVAVLPFENIGTNADNEIFPDGIPETLLTMLMQVPQLPEAFEAIERAFHLDPDSPDVNREAGRLAIHQRRFVDAARHFERAFDRDESDVS
jgi:TolB-like protein